MPVTSDPGLITGEPSSPVRARGMSQGRYLWTHIYIDAYLYKGQAPVNTPFSQSRHQVRLRIHRKAIRNSTPGRSELPSQLGHVVR